MRRLTVSELLTATGGTLLAGGVSAAVTSVSTDSRKAGEGALFIPLTGERFDGHDYIDKALALGAAGCLCARTPAAFLPDKFYIAVPDTRLALKALASWYRGQFNIPVVQITGSVGKTTTKEMIASVVSQRYRTLKTAENFNNDIGTPLTLLGLDDTYEAAVIETGMDHFGEIRYLGEMVRPHIAVITNIGDAHIEFLGSREGILKAKSEIFENLDADGVAILNGDDALLDTVALPQRIVRCGESAHADVRVSALRDRGIDGIACTVTTEQVFQDFLADPSDRDSYFRDISTFGGCTAGPAAGYANINYMEEHKVLENVVKMGDYLMDGLKALEKKYEIIGDVRGKGLFCGLELVKSRTTKEPVSEATAGAVVGECMKQGVIIGKTSRCFRELNNTLCLAPALIAGTAEIDEILKALDKAFQVVKA